MGLKLFGRCVLHDYTKWEVIKEDGYNRGYGDGEYRRIYERGIVYVQSCQCKECGFQKLKTNRVVLYN